MYDLCAESVLQETDCYGKLLIRSNIHEVDKGIASQDRAAHIPLIRVKITGIHHAALARGHRRKASILKTVTVGERVAHMNSAASCLVHRLSFCGDLLKNLVQNSLRFEFFNNLVSVELIQFWVLCHCTFEPVKELVLFKMLLNHSFNLLHLHIGDCAGSLLVRTLGTRS